MIELIELVPDAESLLLLAPEELAFYVLRVVREFMLQQTIKRHLVDYAKRSGAYETGYYRQVT